MTPVPLLSEMPGHGDVVAVQQEMRPVAAGELQRRGGGELIRAVDDRPGTAVVGLHDQRPGNRVAGRFRQHQGSVGVRERAGERIARVSAQVQRARPGFRQGLRRRPSR